MLEMEPDSAGHHTTQQASLSHPGHGFPWADPLPFPTWEPRFVQMAANASWPQAPISDQEANPDWSEAACDGPPGGAELDASVPQDS